MERRVLFVGGAEPLWKDFSDQYCGAEGDWAADFATTGPEAMQRLASSSFDAVVSDARLSDISALDLLDEVMRCQPSAMRIVLSEIDDVEHTYDCIGRAHHHLLKPCDAGTLLNALNQAIGREGWLPNQAVQTLIARIKRLPSPPTTYFRIVEEMKSSEASLERVADLIGEDPAITAKVLQLANSAVFGLQLQVIHPLEAIGYLGLETTKALVLFAHTFSNFGELEASGFSVESLWQHSVCTAQVAKQIARLERSNMEARGHAFTAGLLHDIGKLVFAANLPEALSEALALARDEQLSCWEAECRVMGAGHAEVGACLLGLWGLPTPVVEGVALHHSPVRLNDEQFTPLTAVHVGNVLCHESRSDGGMFAPEELNLQYLQDLNLADRVNDWRHECLALEAQPAG